MTRTYSPKTAPIYQLKITLDGIAALIWRRFLVSSNIPLNRLHDTIQIIMDWTDYHLHMFEIDGHVFGDHGSGRGQEDAARRHPGAGRTVEREQRRRVAPAAAR